MDELTFLLQETLRENLDRTAVVLETSASQTEQGTGLVLWRRELPGPYGPKAEFNVHRWATHLTDGTRVERPGGVMFWSGGYYRSLSEAQDDMKERA